MSKLLVISILVAVLLLIDWYAFQGVKTAVGDWSIKKWLPLVYWGTSALLILSVYIYNFVSPELVGKGPRMVLIAVVFVAYFSKFLMLPFVLIDDLVRLGKWIYQEVAPATEIADGEEKITRSVFLGRLSVLMGSIPFLGMLYGILSGAHDYKIRRVTVSLPNLPEGFNGFRIAQLSDIHAGSFFNKEAVMRGINMLLGEKPDVVFFTGDLVNNVASEMDNYQDVFARVNAEMGVFSVLGNHDYGDYYPWSSKEEKAANFERLKQVHAKMGWRLLLNEHTYLQKGEDKIALIGIENWGAKGFTQYGKLDKAYDGANAPVKILLSHDPSHWDEQVRKDYGDIDLTLSGHTHGMQFGIEAAGIKWSPVQYRYKQWGGLYQEGKQFLYVNRGFGYIGYPGRIGMPPEITIITLQKA